MTRFYTLFATPFSVTFDSTHLTSPLDDPRRGLRVQLTFTPTLALGHPDARFVINLLKASVYFDLNHLFPIDPGRTVLAARGIPTRAASVARPSLDDVFLRETGRSLRDKGEETATPESVEVAA